MESDSVKRGKFIMCTCTQHLVAVGKKKKMYDVILRKFTFVKKADLVSAMFFLSRFLAVQRFLPCFPEFTVSYIAGY